MHVKMQPLSLVAIFYLENQKQAPKLLELIEKFRDLAKYQAPQPKLKIYCYPAGQHNT